MTTITFNNYLRSTSRSGWLFLDVLPKMSSFKFIILFLLITGFSQAQQISAPEKVAVEQKMEWVFPLNKDMIRKIKKAMKSSDRNLSSLFEAYGVEFTKGSTLMIESNKNLLKAKTDHESARRIMLILYQILTEEDLQDRDTRQ